MDDVARRVVGTVRAIHYPVTVRMANGQPRTMCGHCDTGDPYVTISMDWPCPTLAAVEAAAVGLPVSVHVHGVELSWRPTGVDEQWACHVKLRA